MSDHDVGAWHPAPDRPGSLRWWDGSQWTEHYTPAEGAAPAQHAPLGGDATQADAPVTGGAPGQQTTGQQWTGQQTGPQTAGEYATAPPSGSPPAKGGAAKVLIPVGVCAVLAIVALAVGVLAIRGNDDVTASGAATTSSPDEPAPTTEDPTTTSTPTIGGSEPDPGTTAPGTSAPGTSAPSTPDGTYQAGSYTFADVQVEKDFADDFEVRARMTNDGPDVGGVSITATLFAGGSVVGTATGYASDVSAGQTITVELISFDEFTDWDEIEFQIDAEF